MNKLCKIVGYVCWCVLTLWVCQKGFCANIGMERIGPPAVDASLCVDSSGKLYYLGYQNNQYAIMAGFPGLIEPLYAMPRRGGMYRRLNQEEHYYIGSNDSAPLMQSLNGGSSFTTITTGMRRFYATENFLIGSSGNRFARVSKDKGITWSICEVSTDTHLQLLGFVVSGSHVLTIGNTAGAEMKLYLSLNSGNSWKQIAKGPITSWGMVNDVIFYGYRIALDTVSAQLLASRDFGNSWNPVFFGEPLIKYIEYKNYIIGCSQLNCYITVSENQNWQDMRLGYVGYIYDIATRDNILYLATGTGLFRYVLPSGVNQWGCYR